MRERFERIRERIAEACLRVGRSPEEVKLLGASKAQPPEKIREAVSCGLRLVGENYVQEAEKKMAQLKDLPVEWHLIGYLQKNKAKKACRLFDVVETVDRVEIAKRLSKEAESLGRVLPVFVQVNIGREESKHGVSPEGLFALVEEVLGLSGLKLKGLMCIPPFLPDPEEIRPYFSQMRRLFEKVKEEFGLSEFSELSMGMSHDFEVAVEEGATIVRIGTALFGERPLKCRK